MNLLKFLMPKTVASVCDLDKVVVKLEGVISEQQEFASNLGQSINVLNAQRSAAFDESNKARKIIAGINNLLGL